VTRKPETDEDRAAMRGATRQFKPPTARHAKTARRA